MSGRDPYCRPAAVPPAAAPAAALLVAIQTCLHWAKSFRPSTAFRPGVPAIRDFRIVLPVAGDTPPLPRKGRPAHRWPKFGITGQAPQDHQAPDHGKSKDRRTGRAGGTSLYHFAAILPRTGPVRGRSRPEDSIPPPAPLRGEWCQAAFPASASHGRVRWFHREGCLHGPALIAPPRPPHGGGCPRGKLRRCAPPLAAWGHGAHPRRRRPAARKAGSCAALRSRAFHLPVISSAGSAAPGGARWPTRSPGRAPTPRAAGLGWLLGTRPSGIVWPACPVLAGVPAPWPNSARRPGPEEWNLPPAPRWGGVVVTSLYRSALLAPVPPSFSRSFTPPSLRCGYAHSLPHCGDTSAPTASPSRSRRGGASCQRSAGVPARARASLAGLLPYIPAGFLPAFGSGAWGPHRPAPVPRPPPSSTTPARFRKLHLAGLRWPAPAAHRVAVFSLVYLILPASRRPSPGSRLRKLRRHPSAARHAAPVMG